MEQQELFKHQIYVEKEEMKNDPVELEQVFKDINKWGKNKIQQTNEIDGYYQYKSEQMEKQLK